MQLGRTATRDICVAVLSDKDLKIVSLHFAKMIDQIKSNQIKSNSKLDLYCLQQLLSCCGLGKVIKSAANFRKHFVATFD